MLIPGDDISSDLDLSGCNIHTDNEEEEESYTKLIDVFSDIQLDHNLQYEQRKIVDIINGVGCLYPFKISLVYDSSSSSLSVFIFHPDRSRSLDMSSPGISK